MSLDPLAALMQPRSGSSGAKLCWFHAHGKCTKGPSCSFAHGVEEPKGALNTTTIAGCGEGHRTSKRAKDIPAQQTHSLNVTTPLHATSLGPLPNAAAQAPPSSHQAQAALQLAQAAVQHAQVAATLWSITHMAQALQDILLPASSPLLLQGACGIGHLAAPSQQSRVSLELAAWLDPPGGPAASQGGAGLPDPDATQSPGSSVQNDTGLPSTDSSVADSTPSDVESDGETWSSLVIKNTFLTIQPGECCFKSLRKVKTAPGVLGVLCQDGNLTEDDHLFGDLMGPRVRGVSA